MSDTEETGPIYGVQLIDGLPLNGVMQAMPSWSDLEGITDYRHGDRVVAGYEVLLSHWRKQADEIERLRPIVDKLDMSADGVPLVYGDSVYWWEDETVQAGIWRGVGEDGPQVDHCGRLCWPPIEWLHSTREAAEAAKEKE